MQPVKNGNIAYKSVAGSDPEHGGHVWVPEFVTSRGPADHSPCVVPNMDAESGN